MKGFYSCFSVGDISPPYRTDKHNSVCNAEIFGNVQNQLHLEGYGAHLTRSNPMPTLFNVAKYL